MYNSGWKIIGSQTVGVYLGEGIVAGGGQFNLTLKDSNNNIHTFSYFGAGGGLGAGFDFKITSKLLDSIMMYFSLQRSALNYVASATFESDIFFGDDNKTGLDSFKDTLLILSYSVDLGFNLNSNHLVWLSSKNSNTTEIVANNSNIAYCTHSGAGIGLVGAQETITLLNFMYSESTIQYPDGTTDTIYDTNHSNEERHHGLSGPLSKDYLKDAYKPKY